eukprot:scaffold10367_cov109-Skeletonema_dohrnii-CCMP3373.AAC.1
MRRKAYQDALQARAGDALSEEDSGFWIGIAHLLTPACMLEVKACRFRCARAVLAEQARQSSSASVGWENIALASLAQTRKAVLRARKLESSSFLSNASTRSFYLLRSHCTCRSYDNDINQLFIFALGFGSHSHDTYIAKASSSSSSLLEKEMYTRSCLHVQ